MVWIRCHRCHLQTTCVPDDEDEYDGGHDDDEDGNGDVSHYDDIQITLCTMLMMPHGGFMIFVFD